MNTRRLIDFAIFFVWLSACFPNPACAIQTQEVDLGRNGVYDGVVKIERDEHGRLTLRDADMTSPVTLSDLRYNGVAHWLLLGLDGDDHPQYLNAARALAWLATRSTSDLPEGTRLYHTDARSRQALSAVSPLAYNASTGVFAIDSNTTPTFVGIALSGHSTGAIPYFNSGGRLASNTSRLSVSALGRVGIGTSNPGSKLTIREGHIKFERIAAPASSPVLNAVGSGGSIAAGDYKYKVTYVTASGETELGPVSNTVTCAANDSVNLTSIPVSSDPAVTARKVYRTKLSNPNDYFLAYTIADNVATNLTDTKADGSLGSDRFNFVGNSTAGMVTIDSSQAMRVQSSETAVGIGALPVGTGFGNAAFGDLALGQNTTGYYNSAVGEYALKGNTSGIQNTAVGMWAMMGGTVTGMNNSALGAFALRSVTSCSGNLAGGYNALYSTTTGGGNVALGANALYANTTGAGNVAIGNAAGKYASASNEFYVGNVDQANNANEKSHSLLYGVFSGAAGSLAGQKLAINGNVGINTTSPSALLDVNGAGRVRGTLSIDGATTVTGLNIAGRPRLCAASQTLTSDTETIISTAPLIVLNLTANRVMASTPTIAAGTEGQMIVLINQSPDYYLRLSGGSMVSGTNLALGSSARTMYCHDTITLIYVGGVWCEIAFSVND